MTTLSAALMLVPLAVLVVGANVAGLLDSCQSKQRKARLRPANRAAVDAFILSRSARQ